MSLEAFVLRKEMRRDLIRLEAKVKLLEEQISDLMQNRLVSHDRALGRESAHVAGLEQVLVDPAHLAR